MVETVVAKTIRVSIIVVSYNGLTHLARLRESLETQIGPTDEVIIFDNASSDRTVAWISEEWPAARLVRSDSNLMFAAGNNAATKYASGQILLYLNQDTVLDPGLVERAAAITSPSLAVTFAQTFPWSARRVVPYMDWSGVTLWRSPRASVETTSVISGAAFCLHRDTLNRLGGVPFDSRIPHNGEDTNLSLRLTAAAIELAAVSDVGLFHDSTPSKGSIPRDFAMAVKFQRNLLLAFIYAIGWKRTLRRSPRLLAAGWRKADVDGKGTYPRRLGLTLATLIGYLTAAVPPSPISESGHTL